MDSKVSVIGLGYVGLPLALALAKHVDTLVGFDVNEERIGLLKQGVDVTAEGFEAALKDTSMVFTTSSAELKHCSIHIVTVPTPIDQDNRPDLGAILKACETIGPQLQKGAIVAFESTVYPGVTEEICGPALERSSGLKVGIDFHLGYSPERVNPGDGQNTLENVVKVVAGESESVLDRLCAVYGKVIKAGLHRAGSIRVAEAAKVIENTQRDLNIALMNELSLIFDKLGINTSEVLEAAGTKWNFLKFTPGLVGGHCIGVDPYYLTTKAEQAGYKPEVILAGRRINDNMGKFVARKLVKLLANRGVRLSSAKVAMLGLTFKENVADIRNSR
ncbi:MAG: nucleotide sugar dehydrogenase, partial [Bdellovibrionales bacterium]|nr:nucleotide sugar dehydrogenase [Bdellovibrionales bacterium]